MAEGPVHVAGPVYLRLTFNRGAAFSLGSGAPPAVDVLAVLLALAIAWASARAVMNGGRPAVLVGLGLVMGGALSNLADRFVGGHHGAVVDFIQLVGWWPIFNIADAAITIGAVMVAASLVLPGRPGARRSSGGL